MNNNTIIGLDFDGTVVEHSYPKIGNPLPDCIYWLRKCQDAGAKFILWTIRDDKHLLDAISYLNGCGIRIYGANQNPGQREWNSSPKAYCHIYVDDMGMGIPLEPRPGHSRMAVNWKILGPDLYRRVLINRASLTFNKVKALYVEHKAGAWVFSDLSAGLVDEPFVSGADSVIESLVDPHLEDARENGIMLLFSDDPFDNHQIKMVRDEEEDRSGNWYTGPGGIRGWLCPALYKYFAEAPLQLYVAAYNNTCEAL